MNDDRLVHIVWAAKSVGRCLAAILVLTAPIAAGRKPANAPRKPTSAQRKAEESYPDAVAEAKRNVPPEGYASLYVLRPSRIVGMIGCFFLQEDKNTWGALGNGEYSWDPLPPGDHFFTRAGRGGVHVNAEAGKTYYAVISAGGIEGAGGVRFVSAEEGENMRKALSLNPDRWLLRQYLANWHSVQSGMTFDEVRKLILMEQGQIQFVYTTGSTQYTRTAGSVPNDVATGPASFDEIRFSSILGFDLHFVRGILTEKRDHRAAGSDNQGCPAPGY